MLHVTNERGSDRFHYSMLNCLVINPSVTVDFRITPPEVCIVVAALAFFFSSFCSQFCSYSSISCTVCSPKKDEVNSEFRILFNRLNEQLHEYPEEFGR
jgi:hypothetical protein